MDYFNYSNGQLYAESVPLAEIAAQVGTPCYVYSRATLERHWRAFDQPFGNHPHLICYAVKANGNLAVLNVLARLGSGFDIVSLGELERVVAAGGDPGKVLFSGVAKRPDEIERALSLGILCFNVESAVELDRINEVAGRLGKKAPISLRVNPDVNPKTHPYIATGLSEHKFGINIRDAVGLYRRAEKMDHLEIHGVDCHIGSQLTELGPLADAFDRLLLLVAELEQQGIAVRHLDLGGGLGIRYRDETPPAPIEKIKIIMDRLNGRDYKILLEPGRNIAGNAGVLLTRVDTLKLGKQKNFAIVDAAMNDLLRPALYSAWHDIIAVNTQGNQPVRIYDVVGPVCETGDFLGTARSLAVDQGDLLAIRSAGAYGFSMSSNYNTRPRAAEVMVDGERFQVVRKRETIADLFAAESVLS